MKKVTRQVVEVTWTDTVTDDGWSTTYVSKGVEVISIGYLCERSEQGIALVQTICDDLNTPYNASIFIPAGVIKKVRIVWKESKS